MYTENQWIYLGPDYRPRIPDEPHCERCQRTFKPNAKIVKVDLSKDGLNVKKNPEGKHFVGEHCWKLILKEHNERDIWVKETDSHFVHTSGAEVRYDLKGMCLYAKPWLPNHRGWMMYLPNEEYPILQKSRNRKLNVPKKFKTAEAAQKAILKLIQTPQQ